MTRCRDLGVLASLAVILALMSPQVGHAADAVSLRLDWSILGYHAPFFLALDAGYYRDENLDVSIVEGKGSTTVIQLLGRGNDTFAFADGTAAAQAASIGMPVKTVMGICRRGMMGVLFPKGVMERPEDLKGKTLGVTVGDAPYLLLPAFLTANGIQADSVKYSSVDASAKLRLLAQRKVDGIATYAPLSAVIVEGMTGISTGQFLYSDSGINLPSLGIVANTETLRTSPDVVRRFLAATRRGWQDTRRDPAAATTALVKHFPQVKGQEASYQKTLMVAFDFLETPNTKGKPLGWMSEEDWKAAVAVLERYMGLKPGTRLSTFFTNDYLRD